MTAPFQGSAEALICDPVPANHAATRAPLVPNRDCGDCTVCCKELAINEPELQKLPGILCRHCIEGGGCGTYETRPSLCRRWYCGWRVLPQLDEVWRPDKSEILVTLSYDDVPEKYGQNAGLEFMLIGALQKIHWQPLVQYIAALVGGGIPVFVAVAGRPGHASSKVFVNDDISPVLASCDFLKIEDRLASLLEICVNHAKETARCSVG